MLLGRSASTIGRELLRGRPEGAPAQRWESKFEDEEYHRIRHDAAENRDDTDLPTFLRRPVSMR